jgi:hypothetical protein
MGIGPPPEAKLHEAETMLLDEAQPAYHGQLTADLVRFLERAGGPQVLFADLVKHLRKQWTEDVSLRVAEEILPRTLWQSAAHFELMQRALELEQAPLRRVSAVLNRAIEARQKKEDYWPEGRLNAGIAAAAAGDYQEARRLIAEAVDIMEGRGPLEGDRAI